MLADKPEVYFGAGDLQMESFISRDEFSRALVYGLLFHGDLIIPDIFLYVSRHFASLLVDNKWAGRFIAAAVRNGALIPAFRQNSKGNFRDNLKEIRNENISGLHAGADAICSKLEEAIIGKRLHAKTWPDDPLSVGYKRILERIFLGDPSSSVSPELERVWEETKELRTDILPSIKPDPLGGIRRGDVMDAVMLHYTGHSQTVHDIRNIRAHLTDQKSSDVPMRFLKWINYCYQFNQGNMFALNPSLCSMDEVDIHFARHLAQTSQPESVSNALNQGFRLPSIEALLTVDPVHIFNIRDSETGARYFSAAVTWQTNPSEAAADELLDSLDRYTDDINRAYIEKGNSRFNWEWHLQANIPTGPSQWGNLGRRTATELAKEMAGQVVPGVGFLSLVGKLAAATYQSLPAANKEKWGPSFGINKRVRIDLEREMERVSDEGNPTTNASFQRSAS